MRSKPGKRRAAALIIIILAICAGSGCSKKQTDTGKITISYSYWTGGTTYPVLLNIAEEFMKKHPDIKVKFVPIAAAGSGRMTKLLTQIASDTAPDVFGLYNTVIPDFANRGAILNLDFFITDDKTLDISTYHPAGLECYKYKGVLYGLPCDLHTDALIYNKTLFENAGIAYPNDNWTWLDFLEAAEKLTKDTDNDGRIDQYGVSFGSILFYFVRANGGSFFNEELTRCTLDSPEVREALQFFTDLAIKYKVTPPESLTRETNVWEMFPAGRLGMLTGGLFVKEVAGFDNKDLRWDVAPLPLAKKGMKRVTHVYSNGYVINSRTKHPRESWEFLKFITGVEGAKPWLKSTKALPAIKSLNTPEFVSPPPEHIQVFWDALEYAEQIPRIQQWLRFFDDIFVQELEGYRQGINTLDKALENSVSRINKILEEESHAR